ncbi:MAG TPA: DUF2231 domain-containing protein [Hyphomicrobiaceae bacterium]|jgi:uncharacterized membrane protein|nr:DUF2231 domain-containing protein [Hyphomicrobiaceae bacterium]
MTNPVIKELARLDIGSAVAVAGHPVHAMLVHFPIALVLCTLACDLSYWWSADPFWARAALWASGTAFWLGILASIAGTAELLLVAGIRVRAASWTHAVAAMMLLSICGASWGLRLDDHVAAALPAGILASLLASTFAGIAGWHGGKLVFHHGVGLMLSRSD